MLWSVIRALFAATAVPFAFNIEKRLTQIDCGDTFFNLNAVISQLDWSI